MTAQASHKPQPTKQPSNIVDISTLGDLQAEKYVIGACLLDRKLYDSMSAIVTSDDFFFKTHEYIMQAMEALVGTGKDMNTATVSDHLKNNYSEDRLELVGGIGMLLKLPDDAKNEARNQYEAFAEIVKRLSIRRKLLQATDTIRGLACRTELSVPTIETETMSLIEGVFKTLDTSPPPLIGDAISEYIDVNERAESGAQSSRLYTGYPELDNPAMLGGFSRGNLVVIGGESSMGKTAFAVSMVSRMVKNGAIGLFISMEMDVDEMVQRFISANTGVSLTKLRHWTPEDKAKMTGAWRKEIEKSDEERQKIVDYLANNYDRRLGLVHRPSLSPIEAWSEARRFKLRHGRIDFLVVDLLTNMVADEKDQNRTNRATELQNMSGTLKEMASTKNLDCVVFPLSQVSPDIKNRKDKRPREGDFRDSKGIGFHADVQLFVYRDHRYDEDANPNSAELLVRKHRGGKTGNAELYWQGECARFLSFSELSMDSLNSYG